jgi:general secretion pathway protein A
LYKQFFKFEKSPFSIAPDPQFLYLSSRHQEGIAHLLYGINMGGGFVALTGEVGTGKTTLCRSLLERIPDDVDIAYLLNPKLNAVELLASICDELVINYPEQTDSLKILIDLLNQHLLATHAKGRRTVLIIDEAQNLSLDVLEQIRLLTNLETSTTKLLQIILIGQPELRDLLNDSQLRQLNQRITARYHLAPLSLSETRAYIAHRLMVSGGHPDIFNPGALKLIYKLTQGIPRLINILCDRSLLGAYSLETQTVNKAIVSKSAKEVLPTIPKKKIIPIAALITVLVSLVAVAGYLGKIFPWQKHLINQEQEISATQATSTQHPRLPIQKEQPLALEPVTVIAEQTKPIIKQSFADYIKLSPMSMSQALKITLRQWEIYLPENSSVQCPLFKKTGLRCLPGKSNWYQLANLNRPVILEFTVANEEKHFALLVGVIGDKVVLRTDKIYTFPTQQILPFWKGVFLALWKPPSIDFQILYPTQVSPDILWLRQRLDQIQGVSETVSRANYYDSSLEERVKHYQRQKHIIEDGLVGPLTVIHLQNSQPDSDFPKLR